MTSLIRSIPRYDRVERQGDGLFLKKRAMDVAYWAMRPLARFFVRFGLSATFVSGCALAAGAASGAFAALGRFGFAAGFAAASGIFDAVDGMVARETRTASRSGKVLDSTLDRYSEFLTLAGVAYFFRADGAAMGLALLATLASFMVSYSTAVGEIAGVELRGGTMRRPERLAALFLGFGAAGLAESTFPVLASLVAIATAGNVSAILRIATIRRELARDER